METFQRRFEEGGNEWKKKKVQLARARKLREVSEEMVLS